MTDILENKENILNSNEETKTFGNQIEERRLFTYEERKKILRSSKEKCACCGKPLTTRTMTVEHIIPLIKGGTNDMENLTALCYDCNQLKGSMLYMPMGFYIALIGTQRLVRMQKLVTDWFKTVREDFDIERFPLIAPRHMMQVAVSYRGYSKMKFVKDLLVQWQFVGTEQGYTIEGVTGLDVWDVRKETNRFADRPEDSLVALYSLHKVTNDRILAVAAVSYAKDGRLLVYIPWCEVSKNMRGDVVEWFILLLFNTIEVVAGYKINGYTIIAKDAESISCFNPPKVEYIMSGDTRVQNAEHIDTGELFWIVDVDNYCISKLKAQPKMESDYRQKQDRIRKESKKKKKKKRHSYAS